MNYVIDWSELSLQLVLTFCHFLWQACIVGLLLAIGLRLVSMRNRQATAVINYALACAAFFALPVCVLGTFLWIHQDRGNGVLTVNESIQPAMNHRESIVDGSEQPKTAAVSTFPTTGPAPQHLIDDASSSGHVLPPETALPAALTWIEQLRPLAPSVLIGYLIGSGFLLFRFGFSLFGSRRLRQLAEAVCDARLSAVVSVQANRLGLRRLPLIAVCEKVAVPVVVGILKPMILLPPALATGLSTDQLAAVLCHEMAHIRRRDLIVNLLQRVFEALLFFHPVTWWVSRRISIERENCCDDLAANSTGGLLYADALLKMAEICLKKDSRRTAMLTSLAASGHSSTQLGRRIRRLIGAEQTVGIGWSRRTFGAALTLVAATAVSLAAWAHQPKLSPVGDDEDESASLPVLVPEPAWQTKIGVDETISDQFPASPVVVTRNRVLTINSDYHLLTGAELEQRFSRRRSDDEYGQQITPVIRRASSDRRFVVEVSHIDPGRTWNLPSFDVRVFRAGDGTQFGPTIFHSDIVNVNTAAVDVERGGNFLLLCTGRGKVEVIRVETGEVETTLPAEVGRVDAAAFCPDRDHIVVSAGNKLYVWPWRDQKPVTTIDLGRRVTAITFTPDGQYAAEAPDTRKNIRIRDMRSLEIIATLEERDGWSMNVSAMDITPDGRFLVANNRLSTSRAKREEIAAINVWDLQSRGKPAFSVSAHHTPRYVAFGDDGRSIVAEFTADNDEAFLAAWDLPEKVAGRNIESPADARDRLGDGIQWSEWGDDDGLLSGARLLLPPDGLSAGEPLIVEYRLANVSDEAKALNWLPNKQMQLTAIGPGNVIGGFSIGREREAQVLKLKPGDVFVNRDRTLQIDTTGLPAGDYRAALGSAFFYPDEEDHSITHNVPHRGQLPFRLSSREKSGIHSLPKDGIRWGQPVAGLSLGAKWATDGNSFASGEIVEAHLFVANATDRPIRCSVELPHYMDGWLFNVEDADGSTMLLKRAPMFSIPGIPRYVPLELEPGESVALTSEPVKLAHSRFASDDLSESQLKPARFVVNAHTDDSTATWPDYANPCPKLISAGGLYQSIFAVTLHRLDIPGLRIDVVSAAVPFAVGADPNTASTNAPNTTTVAGRVIAPDGEPVAGANVSCIPYAGGEKIKGVHTKTDTDGRFEATFGRRNFRVHIGSPNKRLDGCGFLVKDGRAATSDNGVECRTTNDKNFVTATLPYSYQLTIRLVDDQTGQPLHNAAVLYKEDESTWYSGEESQYEDAKFSPYIHVRDGSIEQVRYRGAVMGLAHFRAIANGYEIAEFKGTELLKRGQPVNKIIRMKPLPPIEMTIRRADGTPAVGATLSAYTPDGFIDDYEYRRSRPLKRMHELTETTDAKGTVSFPYPAFGPWANYRILHESGHAEFRVEDVARAMNNAPVARQELRLIARSTVQGRLIPQIRNNEFLEVYRLQENRQSVDGPHQIVELQRNGSFRLPDRLAGWHTFVHRVRVENDGQRGTRAIGSYGPFHLKGGESLSVTLGETGRSVIGKLIMPGNRTFDFSGLQIYSRFDCPYQYPHEPRGLNPKEKLAWWNEYWESDRARQNRTYLKRNITVPVADDGTFHFPVLPAGTYELRLNHQYWKNEPRLEIVDSGLVVPETAPGSVLDLNSLAVRSEIPAPDRHSDHENHDHTDQASD